MVMMAIRGNHIPEYRIAPKGHLFNNRSTVHAGFGLIIKQDKPSITKYHGKQGCWSESRIYVQVGATSGGYNGRFLAVRIENSMTRSPRDSLWVSGIGCFKVISRYHL